MLQQKYQRTVDLKVLPELTEREKQGGGGGSMEGGYGAEDDGKEESMKRGHPPPWFITLHKWTKTNSVI